MRMQAKPVARTILKTLVLSLPVMAVFAAVLMVAGRIIQRQNEALLGYSEEQQLAIQAALINSHLEHAVSDLRFLAHSRAMDIWLTHPSTGQIDTLSHNLLQLVREKPIYLQARLLDARGMELVRAEVDDSGRPLLTRDNLQYKGDRPYFTKAMRLSREEVHVSRLDLNVEHGRVEEPLRPTLRLSMPLFDDAGNRRGVLVLNMRGTAVLSGLTGMDEGRDGWKFLLANGHGYWLKGPGPGTEWGFQLPSRSVMTIQNAYPRAWEFIHLTDSGRVSTAQGLFIFTSLYPSLTAWRDDHLSLHPDQVRDKLRDSRWILLAHLPPDSAGRSDAAAAFPLFVSFGAACGIILAYALFLALAHDRLSQSRRKEANQAKALAESVANLQELIDVDEGNIARLREVNARLESVLTAASRVSVIATDTKGTITVFNRGAENMLGYPAEEMVGRSTPEPLHLAEEIERRGQELSELLGHPVTGFDVFAESARQGGFDSREWTYVRKDGSLLNVELVITPIDTGDEGVSGYLGIAVDVTERNAALRELEYNRSRLRSIVETAVDGIFTVSTRGLITSVNRAGAAIFGYKPEDLVGQKVNMLMSEEHARRHDGYMERFLTDRESRAIGVGGREVPGQHRNGSIIPLELAVSEVRNEQEHFFTGILRDISKRKRAEEALHAANQALVDKQRVLDDDMAAAAQIQRSLLPQRAPANQGFLMDWLFLPSTHVGGDVFNIVPLPGGLLGLYLIDVSGHGPAAAMVTVSISQVLQPGSDFVQNERAALPPDEVLRRVDRAFPLERFDRFSTMFYMVFDPAARSLSYAGAGHPPPLLARPGQPVARLDAGGTVLGLGEPVPFTSGRMDVLPGDVLLLYTDGCTEHTNSAGQEFGTLRLETALDAHVRLEPTALLDELQKELHRFGGGGKPEDDISLVCIKFIKH
jgi:sigma-B regulation protein RsbU (phosphoserine phosphatase)